MKPSVRKLLYGFLVLSCAAFAAFIFINGKSKPVFPVLKERQGVLANAKEWPATRDRVGNLLIALQKNPNDPKTKLQLAKEFMQEARVTGDYSYYNKAALELINEVLAKDPKHFEGICLKALVFLSQHRFEEAKTLAEQAQQVNPYNSFVYGLLTDAYVELGDYPQAVTMADKMVSVRPDIRSYSRVSYLREIHGQVAQSIEAIKLAVAAGYPGNEDTEWARMVLAHLYEDTNQLEKAEQEYQIALHERPDYPFALAGLGRIARFKKDYPSAIQYYHRAKDVMAEVAFLEELVDLYRLNQQPKEADEFARITLDALLAENITASRDKDQGHYSDLQLASMYLKTKDLAKALEHARLEYQRRPQNIDACETLAWALYKNGMAAEAAPIMQTALRTNAQNPERLVRAGIILCAVGQKAEGLALLEKGLAIKPYMDEALVQEANALRNS